MHSNLPKGLSRISQITDTADIRGENGHPHHPAGQTSSGRSELLGGTFLLKERTTEGHDSAGKQQKTIISMICIQTEHLRFQFRTKGSASNALRIFSRSGTLKRWKGAATNHHKRPIKTTRISILSNNWSHAAPRYKYCY